MTLERLSETRADPQRPADRQRPPLRRVSRRAVTTTRPCTSSPARGAATASSRPSGKERATLELFGSDHEEHDLLAPVRIGKGFRFTFGYTVDDQEIVKDLRG